MVTTFVRNAVPRKDGTTGKPLPKRILNAPIAVHPNPLEIANMETFASIARERRNCKEQRQPGTAEFGTLMARFRFRIEKWWTFGQRERGENELSPF